MKRAPLITAGVCTAVLLLWQFLTVHRKYADDWTAIYYTGEFTQEPPALENEQIHRFAGSPGFDGQFYHFIAHDPWLRLESAGSVDNPRLRWRRILVPGLAWLLAAGQSDFVDSAYFGVLLGFVFLGAYWLSRYLMSCGLPAWYGAAFGLIPAVLVSLDRGTVDVALAALCAGFAWFAAGESWAIYPILAAAPLARETGICLVAAFVAVQLWRRQWKSALLGAAMLLPFLAWAGWLNSQLVSDQTVFASYVPLRGLLTRTLHPTQFALESGWLRKAAALDYLAVLGIWMALICLVLLRPRICAVWAAAVAFAGVAIFLGQPQAWDGAYTFGRTLSPLLIFVGLLAIRERWWWGLAPLALVVPRVLFQLTSA